MNLDDPDDADAPSGSDPVVDISPGDQSGAGDSCNEPAEADDIVRGGDDGLLPTSYCLLPEAEADGIGQGDDDEGERRDESTTPDLDGPPSARSPGEEATCDDQRILRNERSQLARYSPRRAQRGQAATA